MQHQYLWTDVLLLLAIILGDQGDTGADLCNIIHAGDYLNRGIFRDEELESGFARLTAGGLIEERAGRFHATAPARAHYRTASAGTNNMHDIWRALATILGAERAQVGKPVPDPRNDLTYPGFSPAAVEAARQQYHEAMRDISAGRATGCRSKDP